jgi:hypothetical protein
MKTDNIIDNLQTDLMRGMKYTVLSFLREHGSTELRSFCSRLKKRGLNIISKRVAGENYNEYYLQKSA